MIGLLLLSPVAMLFLVLGLERWERRMSSDVARSAAGRDPR
jgi:hypothetical protein